MEETSPALDPSSGAPMSPPMSLGSRLINIYATPGEVFEDIRQRPPSVANWLVPAFIAMLVGWLGAFFIFSQEAIQQQLAEMSEQAVQKQVEKMKASPEQAEQMRAAAAKFGAIGQKVAAVVMPVVSSLVFPFMWGFLLWLVGNKVFHSKFAYMKAVEVVGLSNMVGVLDGILRTLMILVMGSIWAGPHAAMLVPNFNQENPVHAILSALSIMTFWVLAVRAMGLARLTGSGFAKAAAWVFGIWVAYTGFFMGVGFAMKAIFQR